MNARDRWPANRTLANDPARQKGRFMGNTAGASDYFSRIQRYNSALYTPADTRPSVQQMPTSRMTGWQQPADPLAIASRYGTPGTWATSNTAQAMDRFGTMRPGAGAAGPTGDEIDTQMPSPSRPAVEDSSTVANMPGSAPRTNSIQRWTPPTAPKISTTERYEARQDARAIDRTSREFPEARRFLRIDGSAPQSELNPSPAPVVFNKTNSQNWGKPMSLTDLPPVSYADLRKKYQP